MKKVIHKADTRGHSQHDWLDSYHTFSFDEYFDSDRINFGALRVLNDDKIAPGEGFQTHPHKNMEIITIPLKGHLQHGDSKKNSRIITVGEIQTMSAGTGIFHSEVNASPVEPVEFLQIWIMPKERNTHPVYKDFSIKELENGELSMKVNGTPIEMKSVYPWQGMVRKKYSDVYLTAFRDENGTVFAARYGSRIFPKA